MANEFILRKGLISLGGVTLPYTSITSTYSIGVNDYMIDCSSGTFTTTLPTAIGITGKSYLIKNSGSGIITVNTTSSQIIDGILSKILTQYQTLCVESNGSNWIISVLTNNSISPISIVSGSSLFSTGLAGTGINSSGVTNSIFFGSNTGNQATNANSSNFFGNGAGFNAINASNSNFFGTNSGYFASGAPNSNFFGGNSGYQATGASYSTLLGYNVGSTTNINDSIGTNNIIIGTNITVSPRTTNGINIGGILFGTGTYSTINGNSSTGATATGRIGISVPTPTKRLHISGETTNDSGLRLETLTSSSPTSTGQAIGVDISGNVITVSGGGGGSPSGINTSVQFNNSGSFSGSSNILIHDNDLTLLTEITTPSVPLTGTTKVFGREMGGRSMLAIMGPSGLDTSLQPTFARNDIQWWKPAGNSTTITVVGAAALTATGTATLANVATTNIHTRMRRLDYLVTTAAATAVAGFRSSVAQLTVGDTITNLGGFHYICRFGPATGVATTTNRCFVGLANSVAAPTDVEPSTITNIVGCGWDAADTTIQIMHRGAGAVTKISLTGFPVPTTDRTNVYELAMFSKPGTNQEVKWEFTDLGSGLKATGVISTNMPTTATFLAPRGWISAGGTSSVIGISIFNLYIESDY